MSVRQALKPNLFLFSGLFTGQTHRYVLKFSGSKHMDSADIFS